MRPGRVAWIGVRPARREPPIPQDRVTLVAAQGIIGDRFFTTSDGARQVTLIAAEDIAAIASFLDRAAIAPEIFRRNIVTTGVNLNALKKRNFRIGGALLAHSGECHPCSRMEEAFGPGGYNAVRGRGGLTARVLEGGDIALGDAIIVDMVNVS